MCIAENKLNTILNCIDEIIETYEENCRLIKVRQFEAENLLHELELTNPSVKRKLKIIGELTEIRRDRRKRKNENETLESLYKIFNEETAFKNKLYKTQKEIIKLKNQQQVRQYRPRIRNDIGIINHSNII